MEKILEFYSDGFIRNWAKQVRELKIKELQQLIDYCQNELDKTAIHNIIYWHDRLRVGELKKKLKILQTK
jgi:uncharacterized protein Usg